MTEIIPPEALKFFKKKGSKGGKTTARRHGIEFFRKRAAHMNKVRRQKKIKSTTNENKNK